MGDSRQKLGDMLALTSNWDTYGARPIDRRHVQDMYAILDAVAGTGAPAPQIVPTVRRGVQAEWHLDGVSVEITADDTGTTAYVVDGAGEVEGPLTGALFARIVRSLASTAPLAAGAE